MVRAFEGESLEQYSVIDWLFAKLAETGESEPPFKTIRGVTHKKSSRETILASLGRVPAPTAHKGMRRQRGG